MYNILCKGGAGSTKPAGATSTMSDSFNVNPGSLPTEPSSYGLETIGSYVRSSGGLWSPNFSIVKGFHKFGTGLSTAGTNTFYGNDILRRIQGPAAIENFKSLEPAKGKLTNLNIGTSVALLRKSSNRSLTLGLSARYNKVTNSWGGGPALFARSNYFTLGAGVTHEQVTNQFGPLYFLTGFASLKFWTFEFELTVLKNAGQIILDPIVIKTLTLHFGNILLSGAIRRLNYLPTGPENQTHFAFQYLISKHLSVGILHNYIPGTNSLACQMYL